MTDMRDRFLALWRTAVQAAFIITLAWLANHGLRIDATWSGAVEIAAIGAGAGIWAWATHWLQSQTGSQWWARPARILGRILALGASAPPAYAPAVPPPTLLPGKYIER